MPVWASLLGWGRGSTGSALPNRRPQPEPPETVFDSRWADLAFDDEPRAIRAMGWQLRVVVVAALAGCLTFFLLARWLASTPFVDARWRAAPDGQVVLEASKDPALQGHIGQALVAVKAYGQPEVTMPRATDPRPARWLTRRSERQLDARVQIGLARAYSAGGVTWLFSNGEPAQPELHKRGSTTLGATFWLLGAFALVLYLVVMVVLCAHPTWVNLLYAVMGLSQVGNLVMIAIESTLAYAQPAPLATIDLPLRMCFDLLTAAAIANFVCLHPRSLAGVRGVPLAAWCVAALAAAMLWTTGWEHGWAAAQATVLSLGAVSIALLARSHRIDPHPLATILRRCGIVIVLSLGVLSVAVVGTGSMPRLQHALATTGSMGWYMLFAGLLLVSPFLSRSHQILREFALLAAVSTFATSLDLLFVAVFSIGQFASLTLSLLLSLAVYAGVRQWLLNRLLARTKVSTERTFEQLYRMVREVEAHPELAPTLLAKLMQDLFEPLELSSIPRVIHRARVVRSGSALLVPMPELAIAGGLVPGVASCIVMRHAHRGRQLFLADDARLADRITEQLRRAVAFDQAVEQGRSEERARIAQDLHDDIGARLLTLMYKASSPDVEEYVRHTLKDPKTLTRGLAASHHLLSHAAGEWKADLAQRLTVAEIAFEWEARIEVNPVLNVVQWSALTRILRELISNTIAHSAATRVAVSLNTDSTGWLELRVTDNGSGSNPEQWRHGLGLGGIRKRVKQLNGEVNWRAQMPSGITCAVGIRLSSPDRLS